MKEEAAKKWELAAKRREEAAKKKAVAQRKASDSEELWRKSSVQSAAKRSKPSDEEHASSSVNDHGKDDETVCLSSCSCTIRMETNSADDVTENNNQCCVCFCTYEKDQREQTGFLWVRCVCGHWVHEDCYSEVVIAPRNASAGEYTCMRR